MDMVLYLGWWFWFRVYNEFQKVYIERITTVYGILRMVENFLTNKIMMCNLNASRFISLFPSWLNGGELASLFQETKLYFSRKETTTNLTMLHEAQNGIQHRMPVILLKPTHFIVFNRHCKPMGNSICTFWKHAQPNIQIKTPEWG